MFAYFVFEQISPKGEVLQFIFQLRDAEKIIEARKILSGPSIGKFHVHGTILKEKAAYNPNWSFHLDPKSIGFFELQAEVCDANVSWVQEHLKEIGNSTLPRNFWCPWSSKLIKEIYLS